MKIKTIVIWINRTVGVLAIAIILLSAGFYLWIHSRPGMNWLAATIQTSTRNTVQLEGLSGRLPYRLHADQLRLADDNNVIWLTSENIDVQLAVPMLLKGVVTIRTALAGNVTMHDVPRFNPSSKTNDTSSSSPIKSIHVQKANVNMFTMNSKVTVVGFAGPVSGSFEWQPGGTMSAKAQSTLLFNGDIPLEVSGQMDMKNRRIDFTDIFVTNNQDHASLSGHIELADQKFQLISEFEISQLSSYASIIRTQVGGPLSGDASLSRANRSEPWKLVFKVQSDHLDYADYSARVLESDGQLTFANSALSYDIEAIAESVAVQEWTFRNNLVHGKGNLREHHLTANVSRWETPVTSTTFKASAELAVTDGIMDVLNLNVSEIDMHAWSRAINTNLPQIFGIAELTAGWTNSADARSGQVNLKSSQVKIDFELLRHFDDSSLTLTAQMENDAIRLFGEAKHPLLDSFSIEASVPTIITNTFVPIAVHHLDRVETRLKMAGNLKEISDTILTSPMAIGGQVLLDMHVVNPFGDPRFDGSVVLKNGQYRRLETGTFLDRIDLVMTGMANRIYLSKATATDGGKGLITASGQIALTNGWKPIIDVHAVMTNASVFRIIRTDLPLSGNIHASSSNQSIFINGNIWLEPFRFVIPKRLPPSVPVLQVVEINHPDASRFAVQSTNELNHSKPERPPVAADFNIEIKTRNTFVVTGRGLSSEWRGDMKLHGNINKPRLTGQIKIASGYAMLLGRRFNIDDGVIQMTGEIPPNPAILASASTRIGDTVARLVANGTIQKPEVSLTSDPLLPNDEIMALILFGKEVETMSPWQAIALANGLRILSGSGDLVDVIDSSQSLIQVDQIDIKQDEEGEGFSSIAVGKYIGRSLYVEGEKGFGEADDSITVTLELSPRLILETETSPRIREGIGLYWRREY